MIAGWRGRHDPCRRGAGVGDFWGFAVYYVGELFREVRPLGRHWHVDDVYSECVERSTCVQMVLQRNPS